MKKNRILSILLSLALLAGFWVAPAHAAYSDVAGHSAQTAVQRWSDRKILLGNEMGQFFPDEALTRGAFSAMLDRLLGYSVIAENTFTDLEEDQWYTPYVLRLNAAGVLLGDEGRAMPAGQVTRQEAVAFLGRALGLDTGTRPLSFSDKADIPDWAAGYLSAMVERGCFSGESAFRPADTITRAETVTLLDTLVSSYVNTDGDYSADAKGTLVVNAKNVTLKNMKIDGDLIIADGVGEGDVSLDHVTVTGNIILRGGGANSFHILAGSEVGTIIVTKTANGVIRVVNESGKVIPMINVADGKDGVTLTGEFKNVIIASDAPVALVNATVRETVSVTAPGSSVTLSGSSSVKKLDVAKTAENAAVALTDTAKVTNVIVSGNGLTLDNTSTNTQKPTISVDKTLTDKPTASGGQEIKPTPPSDSGYTPPPLTTISSLTATLPSPQTAKTANDAVATGTGYTVSTTWSPALEGGKFAVSTAYTATLTFALSGSYSQWAASPTVSVTNSTSYGASPRVTRSEAVGSAYVVDVEYLATALLAIDVTRQPEDIPDAKEGSTNAEYLSVAARVTADGATAANYAVTYQWYRADNQEMTGKKLIDGCTSSGFFLPPDLSVGTYYFACGMTTDGVEEVLSATATVNVTDTPPPPDPNPGNVTSTNLHFRSYSEADPLYLCWERSYDNQQFYRLEFFSSYESYYTTEYRLEYTMTLDVFIDFYEAQAALSFSAFDFLPEGLVISKLRLTPLYSASGRPSEEPSGEPVDFLCHIDVVTRPLEGITATFDQTTNHLTLGGTTDTSNVSEYWYLVYNIKGNTLLPSFGGSIHNFNTIYSTSFPAGSDYVNDLVAPGANIEVTMVTGTAPNPNLPLDLPPDLPSGTIIIHRTEMLPIHLISSGT